MNPLGHSDTTNLLGRNPRIVLLPGGPGLSSSTLKSLEGLSRSFEVVFFDPPGTGGRPELNDMSYESLLQSVVVQLKSIGGPVLICGHSFGGIQAAEVAVLDAVPIIGLICIASPFTESAFHSIGQQYEAEMTPSLRETESAFNASPSNGTFAAWLGSYGALYFCERNADAGNAMLRADLVSAKAFLEASEAASKRGFLLPKLKELRLPKLFIAGREDRLITPSVAEIEASLGGFEFQSVPGAGHFVGFDAPELTINLIESWYLKLQRSDV